MSRLMRAPSGLYPGWVSSSIGAKSSKTFRATGDFRPPKKGEFYLSGAVIEAYQAPNDLNMSFWIAKQVELITCPCCQGSGKVEKK